MKHCMNCGRDWRLERSGKGRWAKWQMVQWPNVEKLRREIEERRSA